MSEDEFTFEPEPLMDDEMSPSANNGMRLELAARILRHAKDSLQQAIDLLAGGDEVHARKMLVEMLSEGGEQSEAYEQLQVDRVVEGVFDGEYMIGSDGQQYVVPPNYASKSRLVEGDIMKLTIRKDGSFLYKQIGPIERKRVQARLVWDASSGSYVAIEGENVWKVLTASITFFKGEEGDTVVALIPKNTPSTWAAVEQIVRK